MTITSRPYYDHNVEAIVVDIENHHKGWTQWSLADTSDMAGELGNNGATKQEAIDYAVNIAAANAQEINASSSGIKNAARDMYDHLKSL